MKAPTPLDETDRTRLSTAAAVSLALFLAGIFLAPQRTFAGLLLGNAYFLMLSVLALVFIAIQYLASAGWSVLFRRVPEAMTAYIPAGAAAMALVLLGSHSLYHWAHHEAVVHDAVLLGKAGYLNLPFWAVRTALALGLWWGFARALTLNSRAQDADGAVMRTATGQKLSAIFMVVFGLTFTMASIDWVMSLEPHWYSTIFPWYMFSGAFLHALAVITLLTLLLHRKGCFPELNAHHRHDLGKFIFAFGAFWAYLWYSQFLLIWYANIPEETAYYSMRASRGWMTLQALSLAANFLIPAALLLRSSAKMNDGRLIAAALSVCAGRWLDLYVMIMPSVSPSARPQWVDVPATVGLGCLFLLLFDRAFRAAAPVPARDPYLVESVHHHG